MHSEKFTLEELGHGSRGYFKIKKVKVIGTHEKCVSLASYQRSSKNDLFSAGGDEVHVWKNYVNYKNITEKVTSKAMIRRRTNDYYHWRRKGAISDVKVMNNGKYLLALVEPDEGDPSIRGYDISKGGIELIFTKTATWDFSPNCIEPLNEINFAVGYYGKNVMVYDITNDRKEDSLHDDGGVNNVVAKSISKEDILFAGGQYRGKRRFGIRKFNWKMNTVKYFEEMHEMDVNFIQPFTEKNGEERIMSCSDDMCYIWKFEGRMINKISFADRVRVVLMGYNPRYIIAAGVKGLLVFDRVSHNMIQNLYLGRYKTMGFKDLIWVDNVRKDYFVTVASSQIVLWQVQEETLVHKDLIERVEYLNDEVEEFDGFLKMNFFKFCSLFVSKVFLML